MWDDLMIFDILSREEIILFIFDHSRLFVVALFSSESPTPRAPHKILSRLFNFIIVNII